MNHDIISTHRLILLPSDDARDLENYITHLKNENEFLFTYGQPYSRELEECIDFHSSGVIYYSVFLKNTDNMIGYVGLLPCGDDSECGAVEFYIFKEYRRNYFCKEALEALINHFFKGNLTGIQAKQVYAETLCDNEVSLRFLEKMGFTKEAWGMHLLFDENDHSSGCGVYRYTLNVDEFYGN